MPCPGCVLDERARDGAAREFSRQTVQVDRIPGTVSHVPALPSPSVTRENQPSLLVQRPGVVHGYMVSHGALLPFINRLDRLHRDTYEKDAAIRKCV